MRNRGLKSRVRVWFSRRSTRRVLRMTIKIFLAIVISGIAMFGIVRLPLISVRSVSITPKSDVNHLLRTEILAYTNQTLRKKVYGIPGKTRYFFKKGNFEAMLRKKFLQAEDITIESQFLNKWHITAKKRKSFGTYCTNTHCLMIDAKGVAFIKTDIVVGRILNIADQLQLGDAVFGDDEVAATDFQKISEIVLFLENGGLLVKDISLRRDTRAVHINLENGIGIWLDTSEALYDTTRALHIVFEEVFSDPKKQAEIISVDVRNPLSILYEKK